MSKKSLAKDAAAHVAKSRKVKEPLVVHADEATDPESGKPVHLFKVIAAEKGNEPAETVALDDEGKPVELRDRLVKLFDRSVLTAEPAAGGPRPGAAAAGPITIDPPVNVLTLNPGQEFDETITVTIPKNAGPSKADVYFLADTTGSMGGILSAVQTGANNILTALSGLGIDMMFGVGNYKDFGSGDPFAFKHQLSPTNVVANVTTAINAWVASGGGDFPEGQLFALNSLAVPPGGSIGWRPGSKRIIVWFGDAPGHDGICAAISGEGADITEASATAKLVAEGITVLAISTATPGLDEDPKLGATDYTAVCGPPGGTPGQGTRIASATGGTFVSPVDATKIVNTIITLVSGAVGSIKNVKLVPSPPIAPFIVSITPAAGYGPLTGDKEHVLKFEVKFKGIPCRPEAQIVNGTLDVVADGTVVAAKKVSITVPPCATFVYSVKFVCGVQSECECECGPVQPGKYSTEINIHNYNNKEVKIAKRFIPVVFAGAAIGREPKVAVAKAKDAIVLPPHAATMDDCCRIAELLFGDVPSPMPLTIGFLEITSNQEVSVTAVYTSRSLTGQGVDIDVEQIQGRKVTDVPGTPTPTPTPRDPTGGHTHGTEGHG